MAAVANMPFYSTSYGESFGYNERDGSNTSVFRNRYLNDGYRGTAELGPVRFSARSAQTQLPDLAHANATRPRPQTAQPFARTQQASQQPQQQQQYQQQYQQQMQRTQPMYRPGSAGSATANRSAARFQVPPQEQEEERYQFSPYSNEEPPRGVYTSPVVQGQAHLRQFGQQGQQQQGWTQSQSLSATRSAQQAAFPGSLSVKYALPSPTAAPSVNSAPYYIPPYEQPPSSNFAPAATALGNKTYRFETQDPNYAYADSFRGTERPCNKPLQDPGQSIPYGRLEAEDAKVVRHQMSLASWDTFHVADRTDEAQGIVNYNLSGLTTGVRRKLGVDPENYCKWSISRRLPAGDQMRYHLPGYTGFVPTAQLRHGATYGKTTRQCIMGAQTGL